MLKRSVALSAVLLAILSGACSSTPAGASQTATFTASLIPANVVPPVTNAENTGTGTMTMTMAYTNDTAGNVSSATVNFQVSFSGFPVSAAITAAHVHQGAAGQANTTILINTDLVAGDVALTNGAGAFTKTGLTVPPATAQDIIANPGNYFFDVHSVVNPNGVIRGQLSRSN